MAMATIKEIKNIKGLKKHVVYLSPQSYRNINREINQAEIDSYSQSGYLNQIELAGLYHLQVSTFIKKIKSNVIPSKYIVKHNGNYMLPKNRFRSWLNLDMRGSMIASNWDYYSDRFNLTNITQLD